MSSNLGGIRSSVNGTWGSMEIMDLVRKSSGLSIGVLMLEIDIAADFKAFSDAVRFDLNADFREGNDFFMPDSGPSPSAGIAKTLKSSCSMSSSISERGCSNAFPPRDGPNGSILLVGIGFLPRELGVVRDASDGLLSPGEPLSRDGMDSLEIVLDEKYDSWQTSLLTSSSSNSSAGGLSKRSIGLFPKDKLNSFSDSDITV
jgi:hypothetical protein